MMDRPIGRMGPPDSLLSLAPAMAEAAQKVYDAWDQMDGLDLELGAGGICQDVAAGMVEVLSSNGIDHAVSVHAQVGENHVYVVAMLPDLGIFEIDIPPSTYEHGSGYVWTKRQGVRMTGEDVVIARIGDAVDSDEFEAVYAF